MNDQICPKCGKPMSEHSGTVGATQQPTVNMGANVLMWDAKVTNSVIVLMGTSGMGWGLEADVVNPSPPRTLVSLFAQAAHPASMPISAPSGGQTQIDYGEAAVRNTWPTPIAAYEFLRAKIGLPSLPQLGQANQIASMLRYGSVHDAIQSSVYGTH